MICLTRATTRVGARTRRAGVAHRPAMSVSRRLGSSLLLLVLAACSGAGATVPPEQAAPAASSTATSPTEPAPPPTPSVVPTPGTGVPNDPGLVVTETAAPACHDLAQRASLVATEEKPGSPEPGAPLATAPSGLYVATELVEWEMEDGATTSEAPSKVTVFVTPSRWFYVSDTAKSRDALTATWSLDAGVLARKVTCRASGAGQEFQQRAWASPNGFTVLASSKAGRPLTVRYEHRD